MDGWELVSIDREALDMTNEEGTAADATDRLKHLSIHVHPTNHWLLVNGKARWFGHEQQISRGLHEIIPATHQCSVTYVSSCIKDRRDDIHGDVHCRAAPWFPDGVGGDSIGVDSGQVDRSVPIGSVQVAAEGRDACGLVRVVHREALEALHALIRHMISPVMSVEMKTVNIGFVVMATAITRAQGTLTSK